MLEGPLNVEGGAPAGTTYSGGNGGNRGGYSNYSNNNNSSNSGSRGNTGGGAKPAAEWPF